MRLLNQAQPVVFAALMLLTGLPSIQAQLTIPSDGSDGAFAPTTNTVIDLAQAVDGAWNTSNAANAGKGIYDASKWAVTFKYSSVNIPAGVRVTFKNHRSRAPIVWLVQGGVTIDGTIDISGTRSPGGGSASLTPTEPGPGGFRGGAGGPQGNGTGLGPGGDSGVYASRYGNPQIQPLIGGSGGPSAYTRGGSAGGGAILIAAAGIVRIDGSIVASGQGADNPESTSSGGAIRLVSSSVQGAGSLFALRDGRIRIEANSLSSSLQSSPETIAIPPALAPTIWPPDGAPKVRIVSVDALTAPADPTAPLVSSADVAIQKDSPAVVLLETTNFPIEGTVQLRIANKWGGEELVTSSYVSGNQAQATWRVETSFVKGYTTLQARATAP